jgi:hypothetical protein
MVTIVDGQNPILKVPIIVSGNQGTVFIDEIPWPHDNVDGTTTASDDNDGGERQRQQGGRISDDATRSGTTALNMRILQNHRVGGDALQTWMFQLQSGFMSLRRENLELRHEISSLMLSMERGFQIVNGNVRRVVALQPGRTRGAMATLTNTAGDPSPAIREGAAADTIAAGEQALLAPALAMRNPATLMTNPKSLFELWTEYLHGVGGRKPARLFSETEQGRVKYKFTRRKVIWDVVCNLVSLGHSSQRAIDMIYNVYGPQTSVTDIINRLRHDKRNGSLNTNLRIWLINIV